MAVDQNPRFAADLTGDGKADLVGFGNDGVWVAWATAMERSSQRNWSSPAFPSGQGWQGAEHLRHGGRPGRDHRADIVGFGDAGVCSAISNRDG